MTTPPDLKVGILSFAHVHAAGYATALLDHSGVIVKATDPGPYEPDEERGADLARTLGVDYVDSVDALLAWEPDAVIITSETSRHRELIERACEVGAHILCEKPLATSWEDGLAIAAAVERAGVRFMVAYPVRFSSSFAELCAARDSGRLGDVLALRGSNNGSLSLARKWFTDPALSGGGALVDHVVHLADLADSLMGARPVSVTAVANRILHADRAGAETAGLVTIGYDNGAIAAIDCSWSIADTSPTWGGMKLDVLGTGGSVHIDFFGAAASGIDATSGRELVRRYGPNFDLAMLDTFVAAARGGMPPQPDVQVGLRTLSIVLAAQRSAATNSTVSIEAITQLT